MGDQFSISPLYQFGTGDALNAFGESDGNPFCLGNFTDQEIAENAAYAALTQMQDQSQFLKSLLHSGTNDAVKWLLTIPSITKFDRTIINYFMTICLKELPPTLGSFENWSLKHSTGAEEILAMAAVGGLYSTTNGSHVIASAMCNDARRLLLTRVS